MIVPSKFTPFDQSVLSRLPRVLEKLTHEISIIELFEQTHDSFEDVGEFILVLDTLFVLGRIELDASEEVVKPC